MRTRPKSSGKDLPPRMLRRTKRLKSGAIWVGYYYNGKDEQGKRKEYPLGTDLNEAKRKWAEFECVPAAVDTSLMRFIFDRYEKNIVPTKAPRTQKDNLEAIRQLRVFDSAPINALTPQHIAQYRDKRSAKVRANREISLLSHIFNMAREWGYTSKENPAKGIKKNTEKPREFYADAQIWDAVYSVASQELKDAMDLAYLTGQRVADVLKMMELHIVDGALEVDQGKTGKKLRILIEVDGVRSQLGLLLDRIRARKVRSLYLIATPEGQRLYKWTLRTRFDKARIDAAAAHPSLAKRIGEFQFRDIRPKAASEIADLTNASKLLGHTETQITKRVYRRVGETVKPTK